MQRMLEEYYSKLYSKLFERSETLTAGNYEIAKVIAAWKKKVYSGFESLDILSLTIPDPRKQALDLGEKFIVEITIDLNELSDADVGVEVVFAQKENDEIKNVLFCKEMSLIKHDQQKSTYSCYVPTNKSGVYDYAFRIYPKNDLLPHRQDINLIKWA